MWTCLLGIWVSLCGSLLIHGHLKQILALDYTCTTCSLLETFIVEMKLHEQINVFYKREKSINGITPSCIDDSWKLHNPMTITTIIQKKIRPPTKASFLHWGPYSLRRAPPEHHFPSKFCVTVDVICNYLWLSIK